MTQQQLINAVSIISVWVNEEISTQMDNLVCWDTKRGKIHMNLETQELEIIDSKFDLKTYYALLAFGAANDLRVVDYFTE